MIKISIRDIYADLPPALIRKKIRDNTPSYISRAGNKYWFKDNKFDKEKMMDADQSDYDTRDYNNWASSDDYYTPELGNTLFLRSCGILHRENGPAVEFKDGTKLYFINNKYHRENGPALEYSSGYGHYYLNDVNYDDKKFKKMTPEEKRALRPK